MRNQVTDDSLGVRKTAVLNEVVVLRTTSLRALPRRTNLLPPRVPADGQVREFADRRIALKHLPQRNRSRVAVLVRQPAQHLPPAVVLIMRCKQDRQTTLEH